MLAYKLTTARSFLTDLHPGNVMFHEILTIESQDSPSLLTSEQSASGNKWELSFIDAGLVSTLNQEDRRNFVDLFAAVVQNDGKKVGQLMVDRSRDGGLKCLNREMFAVEIGELVNEVHSSGAAKRMTLYDSLWACVLCFGQIPPH
jgi:predicted unusual protein kinase regulating ubiquinone biosynthesis (AarF/ABC1/UbiB family)